ncbi:leucine-rich repeat and calponin homology domain-containing protein 1 isoform X2 [Agrilus planipennis]|uniref:Leucine-rich repeat and calponin homology domain-containing protein 1 isoform X2 n=1 Tax=Agrilus planipennis TaxID=224129 RepID=A0A1W4WX90_AGRPL|nr:leucine-rich repeat and calponin homology domain-containing protein 1 isoform X2 [Agrilus planipennis]
MAVLVTNNSCGHIQNHLTRSLERILEDADQSGELKLSGRKLKDFPKVYPKYNLSDTVVADLSKNRFSELPEEVTTFSFLERLQCYHNAIKYIPDTVSSLQSLNYLDLSRNQLTALPRELCQLPIQILLVSNNRLTCLPDEIHRMSQLTELDASCNQLTHLPPRMGELRSLKSFVLHNNYLLCVPLEITYLNLVRLDLRANRIGTLPVEMLNMVALIDLSVEDNPLTSPPASLCRRGRVHIFKYLETEAVKLDRKTGLSCSTLGRRPRKATGTLGPTNNLTERLKPKRHNVDSGYSTSDGLDKRWSQEIIGESDKNWISSPISVRSIDVNGVNSVTSTPSTISPVLDNTLENEPSTRSIFSELDKKEDKAVTETNSARLNPCSDPTIGSEDKSKPLQGIQTYREYKEALRQQRAQDVPSVYRTRDSDDQSYKTEPSTPTHHTSSTLATSKSDPTPLNSAFGSPKHIFDDTSVSKKPVLKVSPSTNNHPKCVSPSAIDLGTTNNADSLKNGGNVKNMQDYVKPKFSPLKNSTGILSYDNVPPGTNVSNQNVPMVNGKARIANTISYFNGGANKTPPNGVRGGVTKSWGQNGTDKISFTMRREIDKAKEETEMIKHLRKIIETKLKMSLPEDLSSALTDGVVLCHLANHIRPRSVASIHVPSPAVPKLTMARCRRNVDNFIEACRKIGVDENLVCCASDVLEGRGLVQVAVTVTELLRFHNNPKGIVN